MFYWSAFAACHMLLSLFWWVHVYSLERVVRGDPYVRRVE